ncbi:MAG: sulfatase [Candidatus Binatia bacterium]
MSRARLLVGVAAAALVAGSTWWLRADREPRLPARMAVEDVVADLQATFRRDAVVAEDPAAPVRVGNVVPRLLGGYRRAIVAPPASAVRFRVHVPAGAALRFGVGVERATPPRAGGAPVRFAVEVDGHERFARVVDPSRKRQRTWFDERVALADRPGDVEIMLRTTVLAPGTLAAGTPGWSLVRVVHREEHARQPASPAAPSVLVLLVDTLRADRLGCYGARPSPSPTVDALAAGGRLFETAVAQASWTMPSVATLLTGLPPRSHGVVGDERNDRMLADDRLYLHDGHRTLAELAQSAGITTVGVSANPLVSDSTNFTQGLETFRQFRWDPKRRNWTGADDVNATFLRWLAANRAHRFLAYLHYLDPHDPYTPPAARRPPVPAGTSAEVAAGDIDRVSRALDAGQGAPLAPEQLAYVQALYRAEVQSWDGALATLLDGIRDLGLADSVRIVFTADHGEEFQEHGLLRHGLHVYEETLRVPLVLAGPGIPAGRIAEPAQGIDVYPTVAALLGVAPPPDLPGRNLLEALPATRPIVSEVRQDLPNELIAYRHGDWKLIAAPAAGRRELYDLAHDPLERDDRYGRTPEGARLDAELAAWLAAAAPPPQGGGVDPGLHEKLRALGYAQ